MAGTAASTGGTLLFGGRGIRHSRGRSDKRGGRERGGRSRHDNMGKLPRLSAK